MDPASIIQKFKQKQTFIENYHLSKYAILIPLIKVNNETHLLFQTRSMHLRSQPGDSCFPGGRVEASDPDEMYSAIRETKEELNLGDEHILHVHPLQIMLPSPERKIYTFIGEIQAETINPNPAEVADVFTVPLRYFLNTEPKTYEVTLEARPEKDFPFHLIVGGKNYDWIHGKIEQHFYEYEGKVIWGLTAKIILDFIRSLRSTT